MKKIKNINFNKKQIADFFGITPASVYQWFWDKNPSSPTANKVSVLHTKFGIPFDYWTNPNLYELKFSNKKRVIKRRQRKNNENTKV